MVASGSHIKIAVVYHSILLFFCGKIGVEYIPGTIMLMAFTHFVV